MKNLATIIIALLVAAILVGCGNAKTEELVEDPTKYKTTEDFRDSIKALSDDLDKKALDQAEATYKVVEIMKGEVSETQKKLITEKMADQKAILTYSAIITGNSTDSYITYCKQSLRDILGYCSDALQDPAQVWLTIYLSVQ